MGRWGEQTHLGQLPPSVAFGDTSPTGGGFRRGAPSPRLL